MYTPNINHFEASSTSIKCVNVLNKANIGLDFKEIHSATVRKHHFNKKVILHLPDTPTIPSSILAALSDDASFYFIKNLNLIDLCNLNFIQSIVEFGCVYGYSCNTLLDVENGAAFIPTGQLFLSLDTFTFTSLGMPGKLSAHILRKPKIRYVVEINVLSTLNNPKKNSCKKLLRALSSCPLLFDFYISWFPKDTNICPSSIAKYFHDLGYEVTEKFPNIKQNLTADVKIPIFSPSCEHDPENLEKFVDWLGLSALGVSLDEASDQSCEITNFNEFTVTLQSLNVAEIDGFYSPVQINRIIDRLRSWLIERGTESIPWISITVYGPPDCLISWGTQENSYKVNGDNFYTIVINNEGILIFTMEESKKPMRYYAKSSNKS